MPALPTRSTPSGNTGRDAASGQVVPLQRCEASVRLHASSGHIPTIARSTMASGAIIDMKNDGPTATFVPTTRLGDERKDGAPEPRRSSP